MFKKLLKCREIAKDFHQVDVSDGASTSFWYDRWSHIGRLHELTRSRGFIDLGIPSNASVELVMISHRRLRHMTELLNSIEEEIFRVRSVRKNIADASLWRVSEDNYKNRFRTNETWKQIREIQPRKDWYSGVWFNQAAPKFSFMVWLTILDRFSTSDQKKIWNQGYQLNCVLCSQIEESRNHLSSSVATRLRYRAG